jgi:hypothetical protein
VCGGGRSWAPGPCRPPKPGGLLEKCREEEGSWCSSSGREAVGPSGQAKFSVWDVYPPAPPCAVQLGSGQRLKLPSDRLVFFRLPASRLRESPLGPLPP